jgi:hypothetical protein
MGYGVSSFMGYGLNFPAYRVGGPENVWDMRSYGLYPLWVMRGLTVVPTSLPSLVGIT